MTEESFWNRTKDQLAKLVGVRATEEERLLIAGGDIFFAEDFSQRRRLTAAFVLALILHIIILILNFNFGGDTILEPTREITVVRQLARPAQLAGAQGRPEAAPPKPEPVVPKPKPKVIPIPDPTPDAPEPIVKKDIIEPPKIVRQLQAELNIGDITAPPGPPGKGGAADGPLDGDGLTNVSGAGPGTSDGSGIYPLGGGVTSPQVLVRTLPKYTDEAIKAKVQGVVLLQAVVRKNGRADSFQVIRGLGYGLEESAIREIASNWKFKPGTLNGKNVDVRATIEVTFNLR